MRRLAGLAPLALLALLALLPALGTLGALGASGAGCLVQSQCYDDSDCQAPESCNLSSGSCYVQCTEDKDCHVNGLPTGKVCLDGLAGDGRPRCNYLYDERLPAPDFSLVVINPKSKHFGKSLSLSELKGKVVLIYFANLA